MAGPYAPKGGLSPEQLAAARAQNPLTAALQSLGRAIGGEAAATPHADIPARPPVDRPPAREHGTPDAAREARRRALAAAIDRGEETEGKLRQISAGLPPHVQALSGARVNHWKIHKADVPERIARETDEKGWLARIRAAAAGGHPGLSLRAIEQFARTFIYLEKQDGVGFLRRTGEQLAKWTGYCVRHITRVRTWFEANGLFDVLNVLVRREVDDLLVREANMYVPTVDVSPAPLPADVEGPDPVPSPLIARAFGGLARLAALTGLCERPWGLNATKISSLRERRPAPA